MEETHNTMNAITQDMLASQTVFEQYVLFYRIVQNPATAPSVNPFGWLVHFSSSRGKGEHTIYLED